MTPFATDIDLLHIEPAIFKDAAFATQTLLESTGDVSGTTFTLAAGSFTDSHVEAGQVMHLGGTVDGSFPIVEVTSDTELTLSVLYDKLLQEPGPPAPSPPKSESGVTCSVRTFWPQRQIVSELLLHSLGLAIDQADQVLNPDVLKRACIFGTFQLIYSALAAAAGDPTVFTPRAEMYQRLYRRALRNARIELDTDGDGIADVVRQLNNVTFARG